MRTAAIARGLGPARPASAALRAMVNGGPMRPAYRSVRGARVVSTLWEVLSVEAEDLRARGGARELLAGARGR
jgi:hypothetical protein